VKIFKDGYLLPEFINPNYRGLVGWPCISNDGCDSNECYDTTIICTLDNTTAITCEGELDEFFIKQFTPEEIPVGELVWMGYEDVKNKYDDEIIIHWYLARFVCIKPAPITGEPQIITEHGCGEYCVPYLIAETAEDAERLKNWSNHE
jgi:hypothetical protein